MTADRNHWKYPWPAEAEKGDEVSTRHFPDLSMGVHQISEVEICDSYSVPAYGDAYDIIHYLRKELRCACGERISFDWTKLTPTDIRTSILWHVVGSWYDDEESV